MRHLPDNPFQQKLDLLAGFDLFRDLDRNELVELDELLYRQTTSFSSRSPLGESSMLLRLYTPYYRLVATIEGAGLIWSAAALYIFGDK